MAKKQYKETKILLPDPQKLLQERAKVIKIREDYAKLKDKSEKQITLQGVVDVVITHPEFTPADIAQIFHRSERWAYTITNSKKFKTLLASRQNELLDPVVIQNVQERLEVLANRTMDLLHNKLSEEDCDTATILKALEIVNRGLGLGGNNKVGNTNIQQNFVVALPNQAQSEEQWLTNRRVVDSE